MTGILRDQMVFNMTEQEWDDVIRVHLAIQESVRQLRGEAAAEAGDLQISVILGNGGMSATSGVLLAGAGLRGRAR